MCHVSLLLPSLCQESLPSVCQTIINLSFACQTPISMPYRWVQITRVPWERESQKQTAQHIRSAQMLNVVADWRLTGGWLDWQPPKRHHNDFRRAFCFFLLSTQHPLQYRPKQHIYIITYFWQYFVSNLIFKTCAGTLSEFRCGRK